MTMIAFPPFTIRTDEDVPPEVQKRREDFAAGPLAKRMNATATAEPEFLFVMTEASVEAFGRAIFATYGKAWPQMIAMASGAAMKAERDAMGDVK
jgi:hypothetical protein